MRQALPDTAVSGGTDTLVGIDHGFSFPLRYFEKYGWPHEWAAFLNDFQGHWPTDEKNPNGSTLAFKLRAMPSFFIRK